MASSSSTTKPARSNARTSPRESKRSSDRVSPPNSASGGPDGDVRRVRRTVEQQRKALTAHSSGTETDLAVHVYGSGDWTPPDIEDIEFHHDDVPAPYWCLTFDGGPASTQARVLLAREAETGYDGFCSYDPDLVVVMLADLRALA